MRLINFKQDGEARLGVRVADGLVDLSLAEPRLPRDLNGLLNAGPDALATIRTAAAAAGREAHRSLEDLEYLPPNLSPSKIFCLGVNFFDHAAEAGMGKTEFPPLFMRGPSTLVGHKQPIVRPKASEQLDYECELAVVIGKPARHVSAADALSFVAGYSVFNDGSVRDYQLRTSQWTLGKNFDGTGGFGPELVTPDELPEGCAGLRIQTRLNGKIEQDASLSDMIFGVADTIAIITECLTLCPGDVIIMGTCGGIGLMRKPPLFMKPGDVCDIEIDGLGVLSNPIIDE